jgi:GT2 family glycosyltransferase
MKGAHLRLRFSLFSYNVSNLGRWALVTGRQRGLRPLAHELRLKWRRWLVRRARRKESQEQATAEGKVNSINVRVPWRATAAPGVSIILPVYNGQSYVRHCLDSIYHSPVGLSFEVIVVDQNSQDGTREMLRALAATHANFHLLENATNVGFARAINQGAAIAQGEFLAVANSDLIFTPGWLDHLVAAMRQAPQLAVVSPVTNYVGEGPQLDLEAQEVTPETAASYAQRIAGRPGLQPVVDRLVFFCVLLRRSVFDFLGGVCDYAFGLGNYEDDDFCLRARMAGFTLATVPGAFVFHYGSRTFHEQNIPHMTWMERNEKVYFERMAMFSTQTPMARQRTPTESPAVSVIVRTKDRPYLLRQALLSLANQTYEDFEAVVVNDGGLNVSSVFRDLPASLKINYVVHDVSRGRAPSLNAGLAAARGRWITYLDDDDIIYVTHLENLVSPLIQNDGLQVTYTNTNKALCWSDLQTDVVVIRERFVQQGYDQRVLLVNNWIPIMSFMHTARSAQTVGGFSEEFAMFEDWDFLLRLSRLGPFRQVPRITCEYRFRFGEALDDSTLRLREQALQCLELIYERHPVQDRDLLDRRALGLTGAGQRMEEMRRIEVRYPDGLERRFRLAAHLGGFSLLS